MRKQLIARLTVAGVVAAGIVLTPVLASPARAATSNLFDVYYTQNSSHRLWRIGADQVPRDTGFVVAADTSPAAVRVGIDSAVVFKRNTDGLLWQLRTGRQPQRLGNGLGLAAGTRPAGAAVDGHVVTAFAGDGSGSLWYVSDAEPVGHFTGLKMAPGISPAITAKRGGSGFEIVFKNAADGLLWRLDPGFDLRFAANGLGVAPNTSPVVTGLDDCTFAIAFQAADSSGVGDLWTVDSANVGFDRGVSMQPGTSPAINADCSLCDVIP